MAAPREKLLISTGPGRRPMADRLRRALIRLRVLRRQLHAAHDPDMVVARGTAASLRRPRLASPMMRRLLLVNTLPLVLLAVTLLFLNDFQNSLLETDVNALREQAHVYANAIGQTDVTRSPQRHPLPGAEYVLDAARAKVLLLRLTEPSPNAHARLIGPDGKLIADSREEAHRAHLLRDEAHTHADKLNKGEIRQVPLRPLEDDHHHHPPAWHPPRNNVVEVAYEWLLSLLPLSSREGIVTLDTPEPPMPDPHRPPPPGGMVEAAPYIRRTPNHQLVITVAEPVIHKGETVGIIQLTRQAQEVDRSLFTVRSSILSLFLVALFVTVLLSWYLSLTIARPLLRLAAASHEMRDDTGRVDAVPEELLARRDEIGVLARALRGSVLALWARMDAIERFAADVSHELKNPLSSIRSAIETLPRMENRERQMRLLGIISNDVRRMDRLISDISDSSRLDAEMSRIRPAPVDVTTLLAVLTEMHQTTRAEDGPVLRFEGEENAAPYRVLAVEDRLVQVLRNLIGNAISFSPPHGIIALRATPRGADLEITVSDEGPGIPEGKLEDIFDRFYSERPNSEHFGQHSGLGLAISRQIVDALHGSLHAENRYAHDGRVLGARFVVRLPRAP